MPSIQKHITGSATDAVALQSQAATSKLVNGLQRAEICTEVHWKSRVSLSNSTSHFELFKLLLLWTAAFQDSFASVQDQKLWFCSGQTTHLVKRDSKIIPPSAAEAAAVPGRRRAKSWARSRSSPKTTACCARRALPFGSLANNLPSRSIC
mmetsp:Transcript_1526/g.3226  ORF Transcript_1526/g.3226 Transcript_1526/m.3226 type:complete len:151 (+) Transcript_1526:117-569(+)